MEISEERLKELVLRALHALEAERKIMTGLRSRRKLYMICACAWNEKYEEFLNEMETSNSYEIYPVIPASWKKLGYEGRLKGCKACAGIVYRCRQRPEDLGDAISLFPVVSRDMLVKTALCISDTFETSWIADCIERGSRILLLRSGLARFSGKEKSAYVNRIMGYYRQVLEYGIEICGKDELAEREAEKEKVHARQAVKTGFLPLQPAASNRGRKRVITASNVESLAFEGVLQLQPEDIVTDMAKERAKYLNIIFK